MKYHFKIHREKTGFWAECVELRGCVTEGDSLRELHDNMKEALNLFLDEPEDSKMIFPFPKKRLKGRGLVEIPVDPKIAFAFYLRTLRLKQNLTQKQAARVLGIKNIYGFQRLESSKTANPALSTLAQLKKVFPDLSLDEVLA